MVDNILKYEIGNLIILYYCILSKLSDTIGVVAQNSMG